MAPPIPQDTIAPQPLVAETLGALRDVRRGTLALVAHLDDETLERAHSPLMSPLVWDLAHIAAYEDLWLAHRHAGLALLRPELAELYDAFETPRSVRGDIEQLNAPQARAYLEDVRERVVAALDRDGVGDGVLSELVLRQRAPAHRDDAPGDGDRRGSPPGRASPAAALQRRRLDRATRRILPDGCPPAGLRLRQRASPPHRPHGGLPDCAPAPVNNASWLRFSEGGGYERREWWTDEGWAWKEEYDITHHSSVAAGGADGLQSPVCHVSWFEADAFARAHDARLPTELEWERAATWDQQALEGIGQVWEWTSSRFDGYPGFVAHPYREYSEVFFGEDYLVLRGGSWATSPRVASATFRNWDFPQRRQIFAGLRLARDVEA